MLLNINSRYFGGLFWSRQLRGLPSSDGYFCFFSESLYLRIDSEFFPSIIILDCIILRHDCMLSSCYDVTYYNIAIHTVTGQWQEWVFVTSCILLIWVSFGASMINTFRVWWWWVVQGSLRRGGIWRKHPSPPLYNIGVWRWHINLTKSDNYIHGKTGPSEPLPLFCYCCLARKWTHSFFLMNSVLGITVYANKDNRCVCAVHGIYLVHSDFKHVVTCDMLSKTCWCPW